MAGQSGDQGHRFGGAWTELKLDAVHYYLEFYTLVLKDKPQPSKADTRAVDVWYLFPTGAVNRQLANNFAKVDEHKQRSLDTVFGTPSWREDIYKTKTEIGLFSEVISVANKTFSVDQIEQYAQDRLRTLFAYVSDPLPLLNHRSSKIFSLFCLSNSSSEKALGLIQNGVRSVLKKFAR